MEYHSKLLAKEKRGLEKRLEDVELKINRVEDEAGVSVYTSRRLNKVSFRGALQRLEASPRRVEGGDGEVERASDVTEGDVSLKHKETPVRKTPSICPIQCAV